MGLYEDQRNEVVEKMKEIEVIIDDCMTTNISAEDLISIVKKYAYLFDAKHKVKLA